MYKNLFFTFVALAFAYPALARTLKGSVVDKATGIPIAYANVGIIGKDLGTATNDAGLFSFDVPESMLADTLMISMIGYEPFKVNAAQYGQSQETMVVRLAAAAQILDEVVVRSRTYKQRRLGNNIKGRSVKAGFSENILGNEMGTLMKIKRKPTFIDSVRFDIAFSTYDTVFFRLNVYEKTDKQFRNILKEPIYIKIAQTAMKESIVIDLRDKNLIVENNFLVTLEMVKDLGPGKLQFCANLIGNSATYFRSTSQASWKKIAPGVSISAFVTD